MVVTTIEKLTKNSFSVLDFTATFRRVFPDEWDRGYNVDFFVQVQDKYIEI
jgi:hypothetical protein